MVSVILLELRNKTITKIRKKEQDLNNNSLNSQPKLAFKPSNAPVAFLIAAALFFCYIAIVPYKPQNSYSLMLLALCICAVMASLIENLSDPRPRPMHLLFCIYMIFYYLFPGYLHTFYGRFPFFDAGFRPDEILSAAVAVSIFLSGVIIGYGVSFPRLLGSPRQVAPDRLILVCVGCAGAAACTAGAGAGASLAMASSPVSSSGLSWLDWIWGSFCGLFSLDTCFPDCRCPARARRHARPGAAAITRSSAGWPGRRPRSCTGRRRSSWRSR